MPILMLTAADRLDDKTTGFELGADDYLTKPFELQELVLRLRALDRRRAHNRPPVREIAGLRLDPFRREVYRDGRYVPLTRKQFAVLEVLVTAEGGVVSAEELLERAWDGNADPFTNAVRITVSGLRKRLGEPWLIATVAGVGYRIERGGAGRRVDRAPGLSARLKLTLSYAGFLMVAGAVLLAAVWVLLLATSRGVHRPPRAVFVVHSHADLLRGFAPIAAMVMAFLLVFGLLGGWILAGRMLAPLTASPTPHASPRAGRCLTGSSWRAAEDEFRELADSFDAMLARLEAHVAEQQRFAANASHELRTPLAITQTLLDVARNDPNRGCDELVDRLHAVNTRAIDLTEALLLLSRADQRSFAWEHVDLSLIAEEATETLLPLAEKQGVTIETSGDMTPTIGSHTLLLQMTTNLVHNAIVHNLPEQGTVWVTTSLTPRVVVLTVENTGEKLTPQLVATLARAVPPRHRTHTRRPRGRRPRPGDRQEHHPGTRRGPHPHAPGRRRALRHGAATRRAIGHWRRLCPARRGGRRGWPASGCCADSMSLNAIAIPAARDDEDERGGEGSASGAGGGCARSFGATRGQQQGNERSGNVRKRGHSRKRKTGELERRSTIARSGRKPTQLIAMQKVVGSNPISRSEKLRNCGGFLATGPGHPRAATGRGNRLKARGGWIGFAPLEMGDRVGYLKTRVGGAAASLSRSLLARKTSAVTALSHTRV